MNINNRLRKLYSVMIIAVVFCALLSGAALAGTVIVKPGQFDHFTIQLPDKAVAGENFIVKVQAYDLNNNLISNFIESGKEFRIDVGGTATVQPSTLSGASFSGGSANISINSKKAEKIVFSIREAGGTVPVISREIIVAPNKLEHFVLQAPSAVRAGERFDVRIIARDLFDNTVADVDIGRNLKVTSSGTASPNMVGGAGIDFKNGTALATFVSEKTGSAVIELQEVTSGSRGRSNEVGITPAALSFFRVQAPKTAVAGEAFDLLVSAYDPYNNLVTNYAATGAGAGLVTTGSTRIAPSTLAASDFKDGQAVVKAVYEKAEDIAVIVKDVNSEKSGRSTEIQVNNAAPDHFVVVTPDQAISGQRFKVRVEAYDRFNNLVRNYNLAGNEVLLSTSGTSYITPSVVLPTEFIDGIAAVDVMYDRAESFTISAKMIGERRQQAKVTVTEAAHKETSQQVAVRQVAEQAAKDEKRPPAERHKAERHEGRKQEATKPPAAKEPVASGEAKKEPPVEKAAKKAEARKPEHKKPELKQPEVKQTPKPAEQPRPAVELARKEDKMAEIPEVLTGLSKIAAIEARNKAMLVINLTDVQPQFQYSESVETRSGKEWLRLSLRPAVRKTEKSFRFKSAFVGDVLVEEDRSGKNLLNVYIELLPAGVSFDVEKIKNTLIVTLAKP